MSGKRVTAAAIFSLVLVGSAAALWADSRTMLHEFVPADPKEDLELAATTPDGTLPAVIDTPSGMVPAPDTSRLPSATEKAYGGSSATAKSADRVYRPDNQTGRPHVTQYHDPFSPSTTPYKRLRAFDAVAADFTLTVADPTLRNVVVGGTIGPNDDKFFGDITLDLVPGEAVLVPTVGPGSRLIKLAIVPRVPVQVMRDSADNWYAIATIRTRVRLVEEVAIAREAFGGSFSSRGMMPTNAPAVPSEVMPSVREVAHAIGVVRGAPLSETLTRLVGYFRAFEPSDDPPRGHENIYLDLALSKKGVCRHRAYAFAITALGLGIPTRMVVNEAHAWVEVFDNPTWKRIDLGGAADHIDDQNNDDRPVHRPPPDPFVWPAKQDSGEQSARRTREERMGPSGNQPNPSSSGARIRDNSGWTPPNQPSFVSPNAVAAVLSIGASEGRVMRGAPMIIEGQANAGPDPCGHVRVDVVLRDPRGARDVVIGSLSTDESGRFSGAVVVPLEMPVGDYDLIATTPGDRECGPGRSGQ